MALSRAQNPLELHRALARVWANPRGLRGMAAVNHSVVGKRFLATGFVFFLIGGLLAMLLRAQLATSRSAFLDHETYNQLFTMHGTVMMFLFAIPTIEGMALYLLPKLLGSRDMAFPRLSAFGYWCFLFGGTILLGALAAGVAPDGGWFMYTPLTGRTYTPGVNADVWLIGVTFVEISGIGIAVELLVSILGVRTAGMSLNRLPLFAWYMLVVAGMILVGFPPLILGSILLELERAFDLPFFDVARGGDPLLWQHLFWMFGHPEVYIIFLPGAAIVSTLIPAFAGRPMIGYSWIVVSIVATGFISFGLWVHHMFALGIPHLAMALFSGASLLVALPTTVQFAAWAATLWVGRPRLELPMLFLFGFLFTFVAGGLTGIMVAIVPFDWQVHDTHFIVAHMHYVLIGGFVFPLLAGAYYWFPHLTGRMPSQRLGIVAFGLIFGGFNLAFLPMHATGLLGMPRRVYVYASDLGWDGANLLSSIGAFVMAIGIAAFLLDLLLQRNLSPRAPRNPWGAGTLEWAMATPPPLHNFASQPVVASREPLTDMPDLPATIASGRHYLAAASTGRMETLGVDFVSGRPSHVLLLPAPSWLPLHAALAAAAFFLAFLAGVYWIAGAASLAALAVFLRWAWETGLRRDPPPVQAAEGVRLPPHAVVADAPGWWGLVFTLAADASFLASLLFGYFYLWTMSPGWPPPAWMEAPPTLAAATLLGLAGMYLASDRALSANARGSFAARGAWLLAGGAAAGLAALLLILPLAYLPPPQGHAYQAIVTVCAGYGAFHCALAGVIAVHVWLRCRAGFVSLARSLDLRLLRLWCGYSAGAGAVLVAVIFAPTILM